MKIVEPIVDAKKRLEIAAQDLDVNNSPADYEQQMVAQRTAWHDLQDRLRYNWIADDVLNIVHGRED